MNSWNTRTDLWALNPNILHLSHGSFGATPRCVQEAQRLWRERVDSASDSFFSFEMRPILRARRQSLANLMGTIPENIVLTSNATHAVQSVLRSFQFTPAHQIVYTNHIYGTIEQSLHHLQKQCGVKLVRANVPFPVQSGNEIFESLAKVVTEKTSLLVVDHLTSPTALLFPLEKIIADAHSKGVKVLVDGAHVPGSQDLNLDVLKPDYYAGNLHKWMCAAKGCAFLYVAPHLHETVFPLAITLAEGSLADRFEWVGTCDVSPWLSLDTAFKFFNDLNPSALQARNHQLMRQARELLADAVGTCLPHPDSLELYGPMACVQIPFGGAGTLENLLKLRKEFFDTYRIEVPFTAIAEDAVYVRPSAHCYNSWDQYEQLAVALKNYFC